MFKTIAAVSTPIGNDGGIAIIRVSGDDAFEILKKIFVPKDKDIEDLKNFTINYGYLYDGKKKTDEVLISIMKSPKSYTKENMFEINCHGSHFITQKVLKIVLENGAILAEKGEFTKRAFLNGRISLDQAEAVIELLESKSEKNIENSLKQLDGKLNGKIKNLKQKFLDILSHINVILEYPEDSLDEPLPSEIIQNLNCVEKEVIKLIKSYESGKIIKNGIKIAIVGKPNVGKSSLFNALLKEDRVIVTHLPGTTRDMIEETININGVSFILVDTAGIRETGDFVEKIGVEKSKNLLKKTDLILCILDYSDLLSQEDKDILKYIDKNKTIFILNKIDLEKKIDFEKYLKNEKINCISTKTKKGLTKLKNQIYNFSIKNEINPCSNEILITNLRHKVLLENINESIKKIKQTIEDGYPLDLISIDLYDALDHFSQITGQLTTDEVLDNIFDSFCVGK